MRTTSKSPWVSFEEAADKIGIQSQYASRYVRGDEDHANCGNPGSVRAIRFRGDPDDYHDLLIHKDDVDDFVSRVIAAKFAENGLYARSRR
jgi:hypothetical protein